jgi:hypothetical protein
VEAVFPDGARLHSDPGWQQRCSIDHPIHHHQHHPQIRARSTSVRQLHLFCGTIENDAATRLFLQPLFPLDVIWWKGESVFLMD